MADDDDRGNTAARWRGITLATVPLVLAAALLLGGATSARPDDDEQLLEERALHDLIDSLVTFSVDTHEGLRAQLEAAGAKSLAARAKAQVAIDPDHASALDQAASAGDLAKAFAALAGVGAMRGEPLARIYPEIAKDVFDVLGDRHGGLVVVSELIQDPASLFRSGGPQLLLERTGSAWSIVFVERGGNAELLGLRPGDEVLALAGKTPGELSPRAETDLMQSPVVMRVRRAAWSTPLELAVGGPAHRPIESVTWQLLPGRIGYVCLPQFFVGATSEIIAAIRSLAAAGANSLLLDLRGNGGGSIAEAVALCDVLTPGHPAIAFVDASEATFRHEGLLRKSYHAGGESLHPEWPMVVLIDRSSASASEFLAGCLRQNGRALLVGEQSFGKGVGQLILPVMTSRPGSILPFCQVVQLTVCRLRLPDGSSIHGVGLSPDVRSSRRPRGRESIAAAAAFRARPGFAEELTRLVAGEQEAARALASWSPGSPVPPAFAAWWADVPAGDQRAVIEIVRELVRGYLVRTESQFACDLTRDAVLRRAIQTLLVHRGDERDALEVELPPLVSFE